MKTLIIDVGTRSIKAIYFEDKKQISKEKNSSINLGKDILITNRIDETKIFNAIDYMSRLLNKYEHDNVIITGTEALRKAENSDIFTERLKKKTDHDITIITQEKEAELLAKGYQEIIKKDFIAVNTGGGSTEIVVSKDDNTNYILIPFGVNKINQNFLKERYEQYDYDNKLAWRKANEFIKEQVSKYFSDTTDIDGEHFFIDGTKDYLIFQKDFLNIDYDESDMPEHPVSMSIETFEILIDTLRKTGLKELAENYQKDPKYVNNIAIGLSVYLAIAKQVNAKKIYPSEMHYIRGLI